MADTPETIAAPITTDDTPQKSSSHGVRMKDPDWAKWQEIVGAYPSAADAFSDLIAMAQMRAIGTKAGMAAKADLIAEHARQITSIYTELMQTMDDQAGIAAAKLTDMEQRYQKQLQAAKDAEALAKASALSASEEVEKAMSDLSDERKSVAALRAERSRLEQQLDATRKDLEMSRSMLDQSASDVKAARDEVQALRETSSKDKTEIQTLQEQLAETKTALAEAQVAKTIAEAAVVAKDEQLVGKDALIAALQAHLGSLLRPASSQDGTPEVTV